MTGVVKLGSPKPALMMSSALTPFKHSFILASSVQLNFSCANPLQEKGIENKYKKNVAN